MIDVDTTWGQVCELLARDEYDLAYATLEGAMHEGTAAVQAALALRLASVHSLYGEGGVADMQEALRLAARLDATVRAQPLYQALHAEMQARQGETPSLAPALLSPAFLAGEGRGEADVLARYHALGALVLSGQAAAQELLLPVTDVPEHLRWRLRAWQAEAQEGLGQTQEAAHLYAEAAHHARGVNRAVMLQEQAALNLQLGQLPEAAQALRSARPLYQGHDPDEGLNLATWAYLHAQVQLGQGHMEEALNTIEEAARLERQHGDASYGVALVRGQVLAGLGRTEQALSAFEEALRLAGDEDRPYALHELGVSLLDLDRPLEAREKLEGILSDPNYPYQPEVLADLAECDYRLGRLTEAQQQAQEALTGGAVIPASLVLGNVAMDYYHLDDALEHFERVAREAAPEGRDWVLAHQMAADIMAQQGFPNPPAAYAHAQQALQHTPESDDWHVTLQDHLRRASELMQGTGRTLN